MNEPIELTRNEGFDILAALDQAHAVAAEMGDITTELALDGAIRILSPKLLPDLPPAQ